MDNRPLFRNLTLLVSVKLLFTKAFRGIFTKKVKEYGK